MRRAVLLAASSSLLSASSCYRTQPGKFFTTGENGVFVPGKRVTGKLDYLSYFTSGVRLVHRIPFEIDFFRRIE